MSRRSVISGVLAVAVVAGGVPAIAAVSHGGSAQVQRPVTASHPGLARLDVARKLGGLVSGIATFDSSPTHQQIAALRALGLRVQPTRHLPLAYVLGSLTQLRDAVTSGAAEDIYPDERLKWESTDSNAAIGANKAHDLGFTGKGVGVAVVDSGIDATHPALADHVTHNVKVLDEEYAQQPAGSAGGPWIVPVDQGPYDNSDSASGHGTHCAGIVAADGTGDPKLVGVAPDADLIGYSTGEAVFVTAVVGAFDDILEHHKDWKIRVVSNSWGSSFRLFDPADPINVATKKLHDEGLTVVFAAGNETEPMTQNPYSVAPWVIGVASGTKSLQRSDFSSGGVANDDSRPAKLDGTEVHQHFTGHTIGLYHPDVTAPGTDIVSTGTPTGTLVTEDPTTGEATASGTSMATPHVAGAAAVLLQVRPQLTPDHVREVLQVTAKPVKGDSPFSYTGYGYIDLPAAIALLQSKDLSSLKIARLEAKADKAVLAHTPYQVLSTDYWQFPASPVTVGGVPDAKTYKLEVSSATKVLQAVVAYPSTGYVGLNAYDYSVTVKDAAGKVVEQSTASSTAGQSSFTVDLTKQKGLSFGGWTVELSGDLGTSDNDTLEGKNVTLTVAQLVPQKVTGPQGPVFTPDGSLHLYFQPDGSGQVPSPEGCPTEGGVATGGLAPTAPKDCEAGQVGYLATQWASPAVFTSKPLAAATTIGGKALLRQWLADPAGPAYDNAFTAWTIATLDAVKPDGSHVGLATVDGKAQPITAGADATKQDLSFDVPPITVPKGSTLMLSLTYGGVYDSAMRLVWGSTYDSGLTLTTGRLH